MKIERRIHISELKTGMTVTRTEKDGLHFPFFDKELTDPRSVNVLKNSGVSYIYILEEKDAEEDKEGELTDRLTAMMDSSVETSDYFLIDSSPAISDIIQARAIFENIRCKARELLEGLRQSGKIDSRTAEEITSELVEVSSHKPGIFTAMTHLKNQDDYTYSHSLNVAVISLALGKRLGKSADELKTICLSGLLHDVGMARISGSIIHKPGKLTDDEYTEIKRHPEYGYKMLTANDRLPSETAMTALQHHEKSDGSGYPLGLSERQISNITKIVSIADVYDAITSKKTYNHERTPSEALKILFSWSGKHFNETLVKFFINTIGIYPVGTLVMLDSGEIAVILEPNRKDLTRPKVLVVTDEKREKLEKSHIFDLARYDLKTMKPLKTIVSSINPKQHAINSEQELDRFAKRFKNAVMEA
ncbi:HD-GYP domain-containing protein [Geovibrio thiophilus]|uniref:HD-GYP domain-containing protein n=1 Tax=Geovibrio thiophilus TaxID=139438 RepID=A0A3R5UWS3_9BACT|nr:HD-GYP domain-containing protein [Geovibrio thiophilus]QAR32394.1 HD-GYP domain-containing protein [Geovibrio thiophilus]